jgi:hypothetical protein
MALTQVETSGLSGSGASSNSTTGNVFSQTGPFKNRIINGDMRIDQRNAGASVTPTTTGYTLDRWFTGLSQSSKYSVQRNAGSVTPPVGFTNYLGVTSLSAYSVLSTDTFNIQQRIEGFNVADLGWGAAGAQSVTLSFWVRSSITGTHSGSLWNNAFNRAYPFIFIVSAPNTWEQKMVTIAGDTSGTWAVDNSVGIGLSFNLGSGSSLSATAGAWGSTGVNAATGAVSVVGTNGATFYITGVQLEAGSVATPFERRSYGQELALCQRYYEKTSSFTTPSVALSTGSRGAPLCFKVSKRATPTFTYSGATAFNSSAGALSSPTIVSNVGTTEFLTLIVSNYSTAVQFGADIEASAEL